MSVWNSVTGSWLVASIYWSPKPCQKISKLCVSCAGRIFLSGLMRIASLRVPELVSLTLIVAIFEICVPFVFQSVTSPCGITSFSVEFSTTIGILTGNSEFFSSVGSFQNGLRFAIIASERRVSGNSRIVKCTCCDTSATSPRKIQNARKFRTENFIKTS